MTSTISDRIGRPRVRTYSDFTTELFEYDGSHLLSMKVRQRRTFVDGYDGAEKLHEIRALGGV